MSLERLLYSPFGGRLVAAVGEVVFIGSCVVQNVCHGRFFFLRPWLIALVIIAENVSNTGVLKRHYGIFVIENSIWTIL